jgi:hypothetical protein
MGHVPSYLLPKGMQVAKLEKRKKKRSKRGGNAAAGRNTSEDPLQNLEGGEEKKGGTEDAQVFLDTSDGTGRSSSGRKEWQRMHKKGKFSKRYVGSKQDRGKHS